MRCVGVDFANAFSDKPNSPTLLSDLSGGTKIVRALGSLVNIHKKTRQNC